MEDARRPFGSGADRHRLDAIDPRDLIPRDIDLSGMSHDARQFARVGWFAAQALLTARLTPTIQLPEGLSARMPPNGRVLQSLRALLRRDRDNIASGYYRGPRAPAQTPGKAIANAVRFMRDVPKVDRRRRNRGHAEVFEALRGVERAGQGSAYPRYYLQNFHYQTDGYLSAESARLYDHQVEVLFYGGADTMRRQMLVPLVRHLRDRASAGRLASKINLLDIACGTGRFLHAVKENYPRMPVRGVDLSLPYLDEAARALAGYRRHAFVQANGEALPFADHSIDVVTSIFMFHELPRKARAAAAREMARVVKSDGIVLFMDSIQHGDVPEFDPLLEFFPVAFFEPYYKDYVESNLESLFAETGLVCEAVEPHFMARLMVLRPA